MNYKKNKLIICLIIAFVISIIVFGVFSNTQKEYFLDDKKFVEWIQFNTNGILVIIGFFATIISVILTIIHEKHKENRDDYKKLMGKIFILETDVREYVDRIDEEFREYIKKLIKNKFTQNTFMFEYNNTKMITTKFKELTYDIISYGNIDEGKTLLKFYEICKKNEFDENTYSLSLSNIIKFIFNDEYTKCYNLCIKQSNNYEYNSEEKNFFDEFVKKYSSNSMEKYSNEVIKILGFSKELEENYKKKNKII